MTSDSDFTPHEVVWTDDRIARIWDFYSNNPSYQDTYFSKHSGQYILDFVAKYISLPHQQSTLDYGCGPGHLLEFLLLRGCRCRGLEFSADSVQEAQARLQHHPLFDGVVLVQDGNSPLEANSCDLVFCVEVVEHLLDQHLDWTLKELQRLIAVGGYVVITTPNDEDLAANQKMCPECGCTFHQWQHVRKWDTGSLRQRAEAHGFQTIVCEATWFHSCSSLTDRLRAFYIKATKRQKPTPHLIYIGQKQ